MRRWEASMLGVGGRQERRTQKTKKM
ncbi:hypothetical protein FHS72_001371 [Loktanella ponticola]|uniref:Uncharacterized protein n=1 Tax=Yoonia ponticola TaxID=1524255 RepID=A0A7W9BJQ1_9RHOB|nr:hypothetical protein [Yoonia ponticola]